MQGISPSGAIASFARNAGVLVVICFLGVYVSRAGSSGEANVLRGSRLEIVDSEGRVRVALGIQRNMPQFALLGRDGQARVEITLSGQDEYGELRFLNARGHALVECGASRGMGLVVRADSEEFPGRVLLDLGTQGGADKGAALLIHKDGSTRLGLGTVGSTMMLQGRSSGTSLSPEVQAETPVLQMFDQSGRTTFRAPPK